MKNPIMIYILTTVFMLGAIYPLSAQSPGDTVGTTMLVHQTNGPSGSRIAVDSIEGVHFTWTKLYSYGSRYVFYNYRDPDGNWPSEGGTEIGGGNGAGYCHIDLTDDNRAGIAFHNLDNYVLYAEDLFSGFGIFELFDPPDLLRIRCYWPDLAISRNGHIHLVMLENPSYPGDPAILGYTKSKTGGYEWSSLTIVDTLLFPTYTIAASPVSDKIAIAYTHPLGRFNSQSKSDIYYIESINGMAWDWNEGKTNVTEYGRFADSLFAYTDLDVIYDYDDNLHLIWNANWISSEGAGNVNFLYHFDSGSETISLVDSVEIDLEDCGSYPSNRGINKMTLGVRAATAALFTVYTRFDSADCSSSGYANGDLFMQYSVDNGISWSAPENITDSQSPDCIPGECYSDLWPSLADKVTDHLHLFYAVDRAGGGLWEGQNPMLYCAYPVPVVSADDEEAIPLQFELSQNHPNPFNSATAIHFELYEQSHVKLAIFDITGALVKVLVDSDLAAGGHSIIWEADGLASGVYYYRLSTSEGSRARKMVLVR